MCGRFIISTPAASIVKWFGTTNPLPNLAPRYNVAPTDNVPAVLIDPATKTRHLVPLRWGLVPFWAKDIKIGHSLINAKAETVAEKPAFRDAFQLRRCLIPADGFYEWKRLDAKTRQPYAIAMKDRSMFGFAGLWERWTDRASGETVRSCTIITTAPNEVCAAIHDRMPVIVDRADYENWLGEAPVDAGRLLGMLKSFPAQKMMAFPVDPRVGNVKYDEPSLTEPVRPTV